MSGKSSEELFNSIKGFSTEEIDKLPLYTKRALLNRLAFAWLTINNLNLEEGVDVKIKLFFKWVSSLNVNDPIYKRHLHEFYVETCKRVRLNNGNSQTIEFIMTLSNKEFKNLVELRTIAEKFIQEFVPDLLPLLNSKLLDDASLKRLFSTPDSYFESLHNNDNGLQTHIVDMFVSLPYSKLKLYLDSGAISFELYEAIVSLKKQLFNGEGVTMINLALPNQLKNSKELVSFEFEKNPDVFLTMRKSEWKIYNRAFELFRQESLENNRTQLSYFMAHQIASLETDLNFYKEYYKENPGVHVRTPFYFNPGIELVNMAEDFFMVDAFNLLSQYEENAMNFGLSDYISCYKYGDQNLLNKLISRYYFYKGHRVTHLYYPRVGVYYPTGMSFAEASVIRGTPELHAKAWSTLENEIKLRSTLNSDNFQKPFLRVLCPYNHKPNASDPMYILRSYLAYIANIIFEYYIIGPSLDKTNISSDVRPVAEMLNSNEHVAKRMEVIRKLEGFFNGSHYTDLSNSPYFAEDKFYRSAVWGPRAHMKGFLRLLQNDEERVINYCRMFAESVSNPVDYRYSYPMLLSRALEELDAVIPKTPGNRTIRQFLADFIAYKAIYNSDLPFYGAHRTSISSAIHAVVEQFNANSNLTQAQTNLASYAIIEQNILALDAEPINPVVSEKVILQNDSHAVGSISTSNTIEQLKSVVREAIADDWTDEEYTLNSDNSLATTYQLWSIKARRAVGDVVLCPGVSCYATPLYVEEDVLRPGPPC